MHMENLPLYERLQLIRNIDLKVRLAIVTAETRVRVYMRTKKKIPLKQYRRLKVRSSKSKSKGKNKIINDSLLLVDFNGCDPFLFFVIWI